MFIPSNIVKSLKHQEESLGGEFSLLCWNVAKLTLKSSYREFFESLIQNHDFDLLLLQEVKKSLSCELAIHDYSYILSPNIQTKKHIFGVMSAFKSSCEDEFFLLSKKRELKYATHKVSLITHHKISEAETLLVVNLHAINFVHSGDFKHELDYIYASIAHHKGAMIVAGDFNTWNLKRSYLLSEFTENLSLKKVEFSDEKHLKKIFTNSIDHIFYRDLNVTYSEVIDSKKISDHNPIIAKFSTL
ncbi:endonuclease/exonuclease/phosphatase family protein [Sulfurimonas sp.]|uniref:endonuclease/exonuclease/phosphatase family protein n=1 Tax=Sulfurimonas sp. TaxID=2022749 RepID=UPI0025E3C545|nr:endonuclease/exonuclease/phosphatase family protein [Sulfurimonas sp.]MCK9474061.1 endonuclease/exonuclease/phosphatase family protein [Sulfurimonas sp.]MDD3505910.1 endonuclease/exonuclease/phosphatase family protein [Sulfurimonas sp.]